MNKYRYQFRIEKVHIQEKNLSNETKDYVDDKELMVSVQKLVGVPISIILEDSKDFPNESAFFAKCQAEDKASEVVATCLGITFGGSQKQNRNYREDADIYGKFVNCKLESIEQV